MNFTEIREYEQLRLRSWVVDEIQHQGLTHGEIQNVDIGGIVSGLDTFQNQLIATNSSRLSQCVLETRLKQEIISKITEIHRQLTTV